MKKTIIEKVVLKMMIVSLIISMATVFIPCVIDSVCFKATSLQVIVTLSVIYGSTVLMCLIFSYLDS